jgi:hypothetical protein
MELASSISILNNTVLAEKLSNDHTSIEINSGVIAAKELGFMSYTSNAYVPKNDWRVLTTPEQNDLFSNEVKRYSEQISIIKCAKNPFNTLIDLGLNTISTLEDSVKFSGNEYFSEALCDIFEPVLSQIKSIQDTHINMIAYRPKALYTVTENEQGKLIGLHVDNWCRKPLAIREESQNRVCLNVGRSPRYFLFNRLNIKAIHSKCQHQSLISKDTENIHEILNAYFAHYSDDPIIRIKLNPGEAYIAPTELIIHDGSSLGQSVCDLQVTIRGHISHA